MAADSSSKRLQSGEPRPSHSVLGSEAVVTCCFAPVACRAPPSHGHGVGHGRPHCRRGGVDGQADVDVGGLCARRDTQAHAAGRDGRRRKGQRGSHARRLAAPTQLPGTSLTAALHAHEVGLHCAGLQAKQVLLTPLLKSAAHCPTVASMKYGLGQNAQGPTVPALVTVPLSVMLRSPS